MITNLSTKHIEVLSQWQTFLGVLPTRWQQKINWHWMERLLCRCHPMYMYRCTGLSSRVVSASNCGMRGLRELQLRAVVFIAIYGLGHGLLTFAAVPSLDWLSAYWLSNNDNGNGGCGRWLPVFGGLAAQVSWLDMSVGGHPVLSLRLSNEPGEFS